MMPISDKIHSLIQYLFPNMERLQNIETTFQPTHKSVNLFNHVDLAPLDPIIHTKQIYAQDESDEKVNLGQGVYRDNEGKPFVFKVVREVEEKMTKENINHEYLDMEGLMEFRIGARNLLFGKESEPVLSERIATVQSISGTGALGVGFDFIAKYLPRIVYISNPTWAIHRGIIEKHHLKCLEYPYYSPKLKGIDFQATINYLDSAVPGSYVLLHPSAHNPTGCDFSVEQWERLAQVMKKNDLIPFFDSAYQGFATGDLERDAWPIRHFLSLGFQMFVAQSFAKNMGLYGERVGALHVVLNSKDTAEKVLSQLKIIIRSIYSSPARHGATIAATILNNPDLFNEWQRELRDVVAFRIKEARQMLRAELERIGAPGTWHHITEQIGMFSFTGLSVQVCRLLVEKYHVYLLLSGRISMSGVNRRNVKYLSQAIKSALLQAGK